MDEQKEFTSNETRLYFFMLHLANRFFWKTQWFEYGDDKMQATVGISADVLRTARKNLKEAKLIDFVTGGKGFRVRTRYQILTPNSDPVPHPSPDPFPEPSPEPYIINKIKTKINNKEISKNKNENGKYSKREYITSASDFD